MRSVLTIQAPWPSIARYYLKHRISCRHRQLEVLAKIWPVYTAAIQQPSTELGRAHLILLDRAQSDYCQPPDLKFRLWDHGNSPNPYLNLWLGEVFRLHNYDTARLPLVIGKDLLIRSGKIR